MKHKLAMMAGCLSLLLLATACSSVVPKADKNGEIITYKEISDIPAAGYYIMTADGIHPLYRENLNFNKLPEEATDLSQRLFFQMGEENLIPTLSADDTLIYINDTQPIVQSVTFEKMMDSGYTMGISFEPNTDTSYLGFKGSSLVPGSAAATTFGELKNAGAYTLRQINGVAFTNELLDDNGYVKNLQENAKYMIDGYQGTSYVEFISIADVHLYMSDSYVTIPADAAYRLTKEGFAYVNIPADMQDGYYCLNGYGVFQYQSAEESSSEQTEQTTLANVEATTETASSSETSFEPAAGTVDPEALGITMTSLADEYIDGLTATSPDEE